MMSLFAVRMRGLVSRAKQENIFFLYSLSSLMMQGSVMVAALVSLRYVPPELMGIWQTLTLVTTYGNVLGLGIASGLSREYPFYLGRDDREQALGLAATAQSYVLLIGILGSATFWGAIFVIHPLSLEWVLGLVGMGVFWLTSQYRSYLAVTFRANTEFRRLALWQFVESGLILCSLALIVLAGYTGMIIRYVLLGLLAVLVMYSIRPVRIGPTFQRAHFKKLLATGIPQFVSSYLIVLSLAFDQTIILQRGSVEIIGLYAPVSAITAIMMAIRVSITSYVNPQITYRLGRNDDPRSVSRGILVAVGIVALISLPVVLVGILAMPVVMPWLFPQYADAVRPAQIMLVGGYFLAMDVTLMGLYALKLWRYMALYSVSALVLRWAIPWVWTQKGDVLESVALGTAVANALLFGVGLVIVWTAIRAFKSQERVLPQSAVTLKQLGEGPL